MNGFCVIQMFSAEEVEQLNDVCDEICSYVSHD